MKAGTILFSTPMIQALLSDRKTQTRRVVKDFKIARLSSRHEFATSGPHHLSENETPGYAYVQLEDGPLVGLPCPYGKHGDLLIVKEACWIWGRWTRNGLTETGRQKWRFRADPERLITFDKPEQCAKRAAPDGYDGAHGWVYRHARFMPRWASRMTLRLTDVRVQRLQEIGEEDAKAEGARAAFSYPGFNGVSSSPWYRWGFHELWDSINAARGFGWDVNPHVWALTFEVIKANIDQVMKGDPHG